ncbi:MAG: inositol monophosphatase family protein [Acidimicrobiales bacterium]
MPAPAAPDVLEVLHAVVTAIRTGLDSLDDWGLAGANDWQYRHDLVADAIGRELLLEAGFGVLSEESGLHHDERAVLVVIDPVDGSTNASRQIPWYATSVCALDEHGPLAAVVANQATGTRFEAARDAGARRDAQPIAPAGTERLDAAVIATSGWPPSHLGWSQYRCLGAAALDLCAVASGALDGFVDWGRQSLAPWDYLGGLLVCREAGAVVGEAWGREPVVRDPDARRTIVAAATPALHASLTEARLGAGAAAVDDTA